MGGYTFKFSIPTTTSLAGFTFYAQAMAPDPKANVQGTAMTNACVGVLGF